MLTMSTQRLWKLVQEPIFNSERRILEFVIGQIENNLIEEVQMRSLKKEVIIPEGGVKPLAPYSPGIRFGDLVYTSGQIGIDPNTGSIISGGVASEAKQALLNLEKILEAADSSLKNVLKIKVYLSDINDYATINEVNGRFFNEIPPARAIIQGLLPAGAAVEFDAVAYIK